MKDRIILDPIYLVNSKPEFLGLGVEPVHNKLNRKLSRDFERRLIRLNTSIVNYFKTGNFGKLFPHLFSCISYVWSHHDDGRVYAKTSVKK